MPRADDRRAAARLAATLRERILAGELAPHTPLREESLVRESGLGRHTVRAALQSLAEERLVAAEPFRGARVALLDDDQVGALMELRAALEGEAVRLALERNEGRMPEAVRESLARLVEACDVPNPDLRSIDREHSAFHHSLVRAAHSPRIEELHARLDGELQLFLLHLRPVLGAAEMGAQHVELLRAIEQEGADAVRRHVRESARRLLEARSSARI